MNEQALLVSIRKGDQQVIDYLYKKNFNMIKSLVNTMNNALIPEDIYQESFMVFLNKIYESDLSCKISTFLYSVSRNLCLKELRTLKRHQSDSDLEFVDVAEDLVDYSEGEERRERLKSSMAKLGEKCRQIIEGFYLKSLSMDDIAEKLNYTNAANAKNQKYKCMKQLKTLMNG